MPSGRKPAVYRGRGPDDWMQGKVNNPKGANQFGAGKGTGRISRPATRSAAKGRQVFSPSLASRARRSISNAAVSVRNRAASAKVNLQSKVGQMSSSARSTVSRLASDVRSPVDRAILRHRSPGRYSPAHVKAVSRKVPLTSQLDSAINRSRVGGAYQKGKQDLRYRVNMMKGDVGNVGVYARAKLGQRSVGQHGGGRTSSLKQDASHAWGNLRDLGARGGAAVSKAVHGIGAGDHHNTQMNPIKQGPARQAPASVVARKGGYKSLTEIAKAVEYDSNAKRGAVTSANSARAIAELERRRKAQMSSDSAVRTWRK